MSSLGKRPLKFQVIRSLLRTLTRSTTTRKLTTQPPDPGRTWYSKLKEYLLMVSFSVVVASGLTYFLNDRRNDEALCSNPTQSSRSTDNYNFLHRIIDRCAPAVVYIEIQDPDRIDGSTGQPLVLSNGSGFIVNENGWVLTNAHVVINKPKSLVSVVMRCGDRYNAELLDVDMNVDLALLKIEPDRRLPTLRLGNSVGVKMGEWVIALGSPLSLSHSASAGIVSCVGRTGDELGLKNHSMRYIQTDASITFGNSGGPLVNLDGLVIGINNLRVTAGISFAIPAEYVQRFLQHSHVHHPSKSPFGGLGLTAIALTPELIEALASNGHNVSKEPGGMFVWKVIDGTPAQKSGVEVGDVIIQINGAPVHNVKDIYSSTENILFEMEILKNGKTNKVVVKTRHC